MGPTGLNAGWLGAASSIGMSLFFQQVPGLSRLTGKEGSALLLGGVASAGVVASFKLGTTGTRIGYAAATSWACHGISKNDTLPPVVRRTARLFKLISAVSGVVS